MKVLVIPDSHLQDWIFCTADKLMEKYNFDFIVVLGDILDSHSNGNQLYLYSIMLETCIEFARKYSKKLFWLWGNHEIPYLFPECMCSEHSYEAEPLVLEYLSELIDILEYGPYVSVLIDDIFFSHAGIAETHIVPPPIFYSIEDEWKWVIDSLNSSTLKDLWLPQSPIWYRPDYTKLPYTKGDCFQVVGHTPVKTPVLFENMLLVDTFWEQGARLFPVIDTITHKINFINSKLEGVDLYALTR